MTPGTASRLALPAFMLLALTACATAVPDKARPLAYVAGGADSPAVRYAPLIIPEQARQRYNRVGTAAARRNAQGEAEIFIDSASPTYYFQQREFRAGLSRYTNLIYRVHFERVPYLHLTSGKNGGLFIIVTLDPAQRPLLITTVHTCGCYLAFLPTSFMPDSAFPDGWNKDRQRVFGIDLPGQVPFSQPLSGQQRLVITVKDATHRVTGAHVADLEGLRNGYRLIDAAMAPMAQLKRLPFEDASISFYHENGPAKGYVRNAAKPFELLLMSWWVFDARVGVDKEYGPAAETGTVFYTSLRPWKRKASDMWPFADFLAFWGWNLP